jgi:hypothetical protein
VSRTYPRGNSRGAPWLYDYGCTNISFNKRRASLALNDSERSRPCQTFYRRAFSAAHAEGLSFMAFLAVAEVRFAEGALAVVAGRTALRAASREMLEGGGR